jgi:hypothetical protein
LQQVETLISELDYIQWLGEEEIGSGIQDAIPYGGIMISGNRNYFDVLRTGVYLQLPTYVKTIHSRHHEVQDQKIGPEFPDHQQRSDTALSTNDINFVFSGLQQFLQHIQYIVLIIHYHRKRRLLNKAFGERHAKFLHECNQIFAPDTPVSAWSLKCFEPLPLNPVLNGGGINATDLADFESGVKQPLQSRFLAIG